MLLPREYLAFFVHVHLHRFEVIEFFSDQSLLNTQTIRYMLRNPYLRWRESGPRFIAFSVIDFSLRNLNVVIELDNLLLL